MKHVDIMSRSAEVLRHNGLESFDAFFNYQGGDTINVNSKRDVTIVHVPNGQGGERVFYMKRFHRPHLKDMLFTYRNFKKFCSQGELEWRSAMTLLEHGIETYHPAAWGAETVCGVERRSFFLTEKIEGMSLPAYLLDHWHELGQEQREELVIAMAMFFRRLHKAGVSLPDAYLWHLFLLDPISANGPYRFAIIDLHRMRVNAAAMKEAASNLGALLFSLPDEWFDSILRKLFVETYLSVTDEDNTIDRVKFGTFIEKREHNLTTRRKKPTPARLKKLA